MENRKKRRKKGKKTNKKPEDKPKGDHIKPDEEAQKQRAVVRQESGALESESHDMMNRDIAPHLRQIEQGLHNHINDLHNRLQEQLRHMYELQIQMQERLNFLIERQNHNKQFNCNASIGGGRVVVPNFVPIPM